MRLVSWPVMIWYRLHNGVITLKCSDTASINSIHSFYSGSTNLEDNLKLRNHTFIHTIEYFNNNVGVALQINTVCISEHTLQFRWYVWQFQLILQWLHMSVMASQVTGNSILYSTIFQANIKHDDVIKWKLFRVTDHLCGEFTGHRWIPRKKASDAELWCFLWSAPE